MAETSSLIQIKGIRDGLLITLGGADWADLATAFVKNVDERSSFFNGARVALDVGVNELRVAELSALRDQLSERGIALWAVLSESRLTETTAQNLGLATRISKPRPMEVREVVDELPGDAAKWVKGPLRSGGRVQFDGNIVVMGDVNPGAEIVASGSVIVWRIAGEIAVSPKKQGKSQPEIACLKDGQLVAKPWQELTGR